MDQLIQRNSYDAVAHGVLLSLLLPSKLSLKAVAASGDMTALGRTYTGLELYS
jgi:hypothetical protein